MSNPEHKPVTVKLVLSYKNFIWLIPRFIKSCTCTLSHLSQHTVKHVHHFLNGKMLILKFHRVLFYSLIQFISQGEHINELYFKNARIGQEASPPLPPQCLPCKYICGMCGICFTPIPVALSFGRSATSHFLTDTYNTVHIWVFDHD